MRRRGESGYVLLLILLMAAVIGISLYMELPRVAFESQRQKEQLLIERGEQYKRALQVFTTKNQRWPARVEELENMNMQRFLRRRYKDPMTGKEEWREIHIQNGILTDSKTNKGPGQGKEKDTLAGQYVAEMPGLGDTSSGTGQGGASAAKRTRASDSMAPGVPGGFGSATQPTSDPSSGDAQAGTTGVPGQSTTALPGQTMPPIPAPGTPGSDGYPGITPPGVPGVPGMPGQIPPGQALRQRAMQGLPLPGSSAAASSGGGYISGGAYIGSSSGTTAPANAYPGQPGQPVDSRYPGNLTGGTQQPVYPSPGPGFGQPGLTTGLNTPNNPAAGILNPILYGPRPGGAPQTNMSPVGGAGIAGFASKAEADSIMVYNDHSNYSEWEFIYDPQRKPLVFNPLSGAIGTPASQMGGGPPAQGGAPGFSPPAPSNSPFGPQGGGPFGPAAGQQSGQTIPRQ